MRRSFRSRDLSIERIEEFKVLGFGLYFGIGQSLAALGLAGMSEEPSACKSR
jgi:hypothetical protein